jgi:hypothetical protein
VISCFFRGEKLIPSSFSCFLFSISSFHIIYAKELAKSLGIKVVPTFKLFKKGKEIAEVKGAKFDELVQKIEAAKATDS